LKGTFHGETMPTHFRITDDIIHFTQVIHIEAA